MECGLGQVCDECGAPVKHVVIDCQWHPNYEKSDPPTEWKQYAGPKHFYCEKHVKPHQIAVCNHPYIGPVWFGAYDTYLDGHWENGVFVGTLAEKDFDHAHKTTKI